MGNRIFRLVLIVLTILTSAEMLYADVTGSILGVVRDRSDAVVAGAKVVVTNTQNNLTQETVSAADGSFRIMALPAGTYRLTVAAKGFKPFTETDVVVKVNDQFRVDVTLDVGSLTEEVEVQANAVQVQTENTQLGDVIDSKKMLALPLNGRSYIDLLGLQAGVAPGTSESIQQDRPVSGTMNPGNISVNGQRETANAFLVNGGDVSEGRNNGAGFVPNLDSVEEFRLITNSFDAEYGKFSGAVMNAITKSGTNSFHGDALNFCAMTCSTRVDISIPAKPNCVRINSGTPRVDRSGGTSFFGLATIRAPVSCVAPAQVSCPYPQRTNGTAYSTRLILSMVQAIRQRSKVPTGPRC